MRDSNYKISNEFGAGISISFIVGKDINYQESFLFNIWIIQFCEDHDLEMFDCLFLGKRRKINLNPGFRNLSEALY